MFFDSLHLVPVVEWSIRARRIERPLFLGRNASLSTYTTINMEK
jgi:hypothetical protein